MKKMLSIVLICALTLTAFAAGVFGISSSIIKSHDIKARAVYYEQSQKLVGEINNRIIVKSRKPVDTMGAAAVASGWDNRYYLQFDSKQSADRAYDYYSKCKGVYALYRDAELESDSTDNPMNPKCYGTINSNLDDAMKLISAHFNDAPEVKIAIVDVQAEYSSIFGDRVQGTVASIGNATTNSQKHGTYIAGTMFYNTPDNVTIVSYSCGTSGISSEMASQNILQAVDDGCRIINMSFSSDKVMDNIYASVVQAYSQGAILVSSAGNKGTDLSESPRYPACHDEVLAIGNLTSGKRLASTSCYGEPVFSYTTGMDIRTYYKGEEITWSGTSASAPLACCAFACLLSVKPDASYDELVSTVSETAFPADEDSSLRFIIDAYAAAEKLSGKSLPENTLSYSLELNSSGSYYLSLSASRSGSDIYYYKTTSPFKIPGERSCAVSDFTYTQGSTLTLKENELVCAVAYKDGYKKSERINIAFPTDIESITGTDVKQFAFSDNDNLETVILPENVKFINRYAFNNCKNLKKVIAPGVTYIGRFAFYNCPQLKEVIAPNAFNPYTASFMGCESLEIVQVKFNQYDTAIKNKCFDGCDKLLNYYGKDDTYYFERFDGNDIIYRSYTNGDTLTKSADEMLYLWNECYLINRIETDSLYRTRFCFSDTLFDVNGDKIINAKDYALILKHTQTGEGNA